MDAEAIRRRFRLVDAAKYPELRHLTRSDIYDGKMGPGGLFLAAQMARRMPLREGMRVMDLGCGRGRTSVLLAQAYGVQVLAVDLWIAAEEISAIARRHGCENRIQAINHDVTQAWPPDVAQVDAVFCMDAFHYFGADDGFIDHLAEVLKPGGHVAVGNPCFDREFVTPPPKAYEAFWPREFSKYHSPGWWAEVFRRSDAFTDIVSGEAEDGVVLWEDALLHDLEAGNAKGGRLEADADEIVCGEDDPARPYLTHYVLTCRKRT